MKTFLSALLVVLFSVVANAQSGLVCEDPIPVDENFTATITGSCERWYVANTYDLPLHVYFSPFSDNSTLAPEVTIDFTCEYGKYDDPKLDSLINTISDFGLEFPVELRCDLVVRDGRNEWDLSIDKSYREQIAKFGITYNLQALVKVFYPEGGSISLKPDTLFKNCLETSEFIQLDDTIEVLPGDVERVFVVSYADWQNDSTRLVWIGEGDTRIWLAETMCDFEPSLLDPFVWTYFDVNEEDPYKLYSEQMKEDIKNHAGGGVFFAKVVSESAGQLIVEKIPMGAIQGGATLLQYDVPVQLAANDNRVFCFPRTWTSTEFVANTQFVMSMYTSNTSEFTPSVDDTNVLNKYDYSNVNNMRVAQLSTADIANLVTKATDDYVYVRFTCNEATTLTPKVWTPTSCADKSILIHPDHQLTIAKKPNSTIYRLKYDDWKDYDMTFKWTGTSAIPSYFADACEFTLSSSNSHVLTYKNVKAKGSSTITVANMETWASRVDEDGFVYVRFNPNNQGKVTFTSAKPVEEDPVIPTNSCVLNSIELKANDQITLNLDSAFTVYRINYSEWATTGATLNWKGTEPLHTFVAETCEFAVASYNKYVHVYEAVVAGGTAVLDATRLASLAAYVDEDGYLYIRFLTEKEGTLEVK